MSFTISTAAVDAIKALRSSNEWQAIKDNLHAEMAKMMNRALDAPADEAHAHRGYARALRDLWLAFEAATLGVPHNQVKKPAPVVKA